jgi:hypothetical protein
MVRSVKTHLHFNWKCEDEPENLEEEDFILKQKAKFMLASALFC